MVLTPRQLDAMVWLGEPSTPATHVTEEMIEDLESIGIVEFDRVTETVKFTPAGRVAYRDAVGHWPTRNL
ncbi:MAG TPA: hypothetical protein VGH74_00040 [Planctomycetaceae bacterium]|jgi:hypothetical protein